MDAPDSMKSVKFPSSFRLWLTVRAAFGQINTGDSEAILGVSEFFSIILSRRTLFFPSNLRKMLCMDHVKLVRDGFCPIELIIESFRKHDLDDF